ncbi:uncharacterized protein TRIADDRAFT_51689 [Trichoplax adhaerens]|uniref:Centromere/kinetochore protein zw10 homolog n=1 Tax=Trichoplax adhaerens TaxID=10228 RepID=B3RKI1_TRIAD|nr:hypothetical protein TRIADDRAFT_51689 [Trichoplax adhaerens]EDV29406.1 hypothetical protein TRIADDRAFT_51689 [Trichoplax adhaerens]|eukprot:XP_002108608.1 hypothetical protein TRIADDRAFT_51689 [Trichoplax adhaerens]
METPDTKKQNVDKGEDADEILSSLWRSANELKGHIYSTIMKQYDEFIHTYNTMNELHLKVKEMDVKLRNVSKKMQGDIKPLLKTAKNEQISVQDNLKMVTVIVEALTRLSQINELLSSFSLRLDHKEFDLAANCIVEAQHMLSEVYGNCDAKIFKALRQEARRKRANLQSILESEWDKSISWALPQISLSTPEKILLGTEIKVCADLIQEGDDSENKIQPVVTAMEILGMLRPKLNTFAKKLLRYVLKPLIAESRLVEVLVFLHDQVFDRIKVTVNTEEDKDDTKVSKPLLSILGLIIWPTLSKSIIEEYLAASIPTSFSELENYAEISNQTTLFEYTLKGLGYLEETIDTLTDYTKHVNMNFANKQVQDLLVTARDLLKSDLYNTQQTQISPDKALFDEWSQPDDSALKELHQIDENAATENPKTLEMSLFLFPQCRVSTNICELMSLAYETLQEAVKSTPDCAIQLFYATRNMFDLYLEVTPAYHKMNLETIPQLSALHYNNCMYVSHHLLTLGAEFRDHLPPPLSNGAATFVDIVPFLRSSGQQCLSQQLQRQEQIIKNCLNSTASWNEIAENNRSNDISQHLEQAFHQLNHLSRVWFDVLPIKLCMKLIEDLTNTLIVDVVNKIVQIEDISEDDGHLIHDLLELTKSKILELYSGIIKNDDNLDQEISNHVSGWNKLSELALILAFNLKGIVERWNTPQSTLSAAFTAPEVHSLIRALFQNTKQRSTAINSIKTLH